MVAIMEMVWVTIHHHQHLHLLIMKVIVEVILMEMVIVIHPMVPHLAVSQVAVEVIVILMGMVIVIHLTVNHQEVVVMIHLQELHLYHHLPLIRIIKTMAMVMTMETVIIHPQTHQHLHLPMMEVIVEAILMVTVIVILPMVPHQDLNQVVLIQMEMETVTHRELDHLEVIHPRNLHQVAVEVIVMVMEIVIPLMVNHQAVHPNQVVLIHPIVIQVVHQIAAHHQIQEPHLYHHPLLIHMTKTKAI
mmetsp:Transcript_48467/g.43437  ORF Transcript_48467/g.43437 Transcript_48467/m.43437 type:complete len:246 (-) Transcript_48467:944-1681(-)